MSRFVTLRSTTLLIALATLIGSQALAQQVTRGPYLQMATDSSVTILWSTDQPTDSRVVYGPHVDALSSAVEDFVLSTDHALTLTGLEPGLPHYYAVGSTTSLLAGGDAQHVFTTSPSPGSASPARIWVLGDSGLGGGAGVQVRDAYYANTGAASTELVLMLGDNAYPSGTQQNYQQNLFDFYPEVLRSAPLWPAIGNHDSFDGTTGSWPYFDIFMLPESGEAGGVASGTEAYYSFDYANAHFVVLDSTTYPGGGLAQSPMLPWLEADLAATSQRWIVTYFHHPPYSKGSHDSDDPNDSNGRLVDMREQVVPILEDHGVDLVLSGHSHSYERSFLIHGHYGDSTTWIEEMKVDGGDGAASDAYQAEGPGTVYSVAGSASLTSGGTFDHPAMYDGQNTLGSVVLQLSGNRLDVDFLDFEGQVEDNYTLIKGGCDDDGLCEAGEDCYICPGDCAQSSGATCGNGVCEIAAGEDCVSCSADCRGKQNGNPNNRYCCGDGDGVGPVPITDPRCSTAGYWISDQTPTPACCGDEVCSGAEDGLVCALDCGGTPPTCQPLGADCDSDADCCSNKCKGKPGSKVCK